MSHCAYVACGAGLQMMTRVVARAAPTAWMGTIRSPKERPTSSEPTMTPTTNMVTAPPTGAPPANARPKNQLVRRLAINIEKMGHGTVRPADNFMKYTVATFATAAIAIITDTLS